MITRRRREIIRAGGIAGLLSLAGCSGLTNGLGGGASGPDGWPMYQRGPAHTGSNPAASGPGSDLTVRWRTTAASLFEGDGEQLQIPAISPPAVVDGTVYATASTNREAVGVRAVALDASDGTVEWQTDVTDRFVFSTGHNLPQPSVLDGTVAVTIPGLYWSARAVGLDAATGDERWRHDGERYPVASGTGRDGQFVFGAETAFALDDDGSLAWEANEGDPPSFARADFPPTVTDDAVYVPARRSLFAFERDGTERWTRDLVFEASPIDLTPTRPYTPVAGDAIYTATGNLEQGGDGRLLALDPADGSTRWEFKPAVDSEKRMEMFEASHEETGQVVPLGVGVYSTPAFANGTLYAIGQTLPEEYQQGPVPRLFAIDADSGTKEWATRLSSGVGLAPPVVAGDTVYVPAQDVLLAIDATSGEIRQSASVTDDPIRRMAVVGDTVYAGDATSITAIGP